MPNGQEPGKKRNPLLPTAEQIAQMRRVGLNPYDVVAGPSLRAFTNYTTKQAPPGRRYRRLAETGMPVEALEPFGAGVQVVSGMVGALLDVFGIGSETQVDVGEVTETATVVDPTSPKVPASALEQDNVQLTPREQRLRHMKRLFAALKGSLVSPTGIPTHSGIDLDVALGNMAEAETFEEKVVDEIGVLLANIGVFAPLGLGIGVGTLGGRLAGGPAAAAARPIAAAIGRTLGKTPVRGLAERIAARTALKTEDILTRMANVGIDAAFGTGFGVAEIGGAEAVRGEEIALSDKAKAIGLMTLAGGTLGLAIHGTGGYLANRRVAQLNDVLEGIRMPLRPGDVVEGRVYGIDKNGRPGWRWAEGEKKGNFAKPPSDEGLQEAGYRIVSELADQTAAADAAEAIVEAGARPSPARAVTTPADMQGHLPEISTLAASYQPRLEQRAANLVRTRGIGAEEVLRREAEETRALFVNSSLTPEQRVTAGARLVALEQILSEGGAGASSKLAIERAALALARVGRERGKVWVDGQVALLRSYGDNLVADRLEALVASGIPEAEHKAVLQMLKQADKRYSRGFWEGSRIVMDDGRVAQLVERPMYGAARGRILNAGEAAEEGLVMVDLSQARAIPEAGRRVWLGDELGLVVVEEVTPESGQFIGRNPFTNERKPYQMADIIATSDSPASAKSLAQVEAEIMETLAAGQGDVVPVTPAEAVTAEGEKVIVTGVGPEAIEVQTRGGRRRTMKRGDVRPSRASEPNQIVDYAPGTLPRQDPEKHKLLFVEVPKNQVDAFEAAVRARSLPSAGVIVNTHVLPPTPSDLTSLYAVELPSRQVPKRMYSEEANQALQALGGRGKLESYNSPVAVPPDRLQKGQFYRVSDELRAAAQRPEEALAVMEPGEQQRYLRHLAVVNEEINTEVAKAASRSRAGRTARNAAVKENDGPGFLAAESQVVEADAATLKASLKQGDEVRRAAEEAVYRDVQSRSDDAPFRRAFEEQGLTEENLAYWNSQIELLHANDVGVLPEDQLVLVHRQNPGDRLVVTRRRAPTLRGGETGTMSYWEVTALDQRGGVLWSDNFYTAQGVTNQVVEGGYIASLTKLQRGRWVQRGDAPKIVADIYPIAGPGVPRGAEILTRIEQRIELPQGRAMREIQLEGTKAEYERLQTLVEDAEFDFVQPPAGTRGEMGTISVTVADDEAVRGVAEAFRQIDPTRRARVSRVFGGGKITQHVRRAAIDAAEAEGAVTAEEANFARRMVDEGITTQELVEAQKAGRRGEGPEVPEVLTDTAIRVWTSISNKAQDIGSGGIVYRELSRKGHASMKAAEQYLRSENMVQVKDISPEMATDLGSPILRFERLPNIDAVVKDPEALLGMAEDMEWIVKSIYREQRNIPGPVMEYAREFGKAYEREFGVPLYNREIREVLTIPTAHDLAPRAARPVNLEVEGMSPEDLAGLSVQTLPGAPEMHLGPPTPAPRTEPFIYADVQMGKRVPGGALIDAAVGMHKQQARQTEWTFSLQKNMGESAENSLQVWGHSNKAYGRYKATGQAVEILDANLTSDNVLVKFPDGSTKELAKDAVKQARPKSLPGDALQYEMAAKVATGDYSGFIHREPPLGYDEVEQSLGLLGTNSMGAVRERAFARIDELLKGVRFRKGAIQAPAETIEELVKIYRRLQWIGAPKERVSRAGGIRHKVTERRTLFDEAIQKLPKERRTPMRRAILARVKAEYGFTPLGDMISRAYAGLLSKEQTRLLREWGSAMNMPERTPIGRVAEESLFRTEMHKTAAHIMAQFRKNMGFVGLTGPEMGGTNINLPYGSLKLSYPRVADIGNIWYRFFGISHHTAERHPVTRAVMDLIRLADETQLRRTTTADLVERTLQGYGYSDSDFRALKKLIGTHATWREALDAGADERLAYGFSRLKEHFEQGREDMIRLYLRRNIQPVSFDKTGNPRLVNYVTQHMGYDPDKIVDGALFLFPNPNDLVKAGVTTGGATRSKWTADQIEDFIRMLRDFPDAASLPEGVDETMVAMFDFWKGWGIKNYWPLVHEGNIGIFRQLADGTEELLGWAPSVPDAFHATRQLAGDGKINLALDNINIRETRHTVDDIMLRRVPSKEMERTVTELAKLIDFQPDEVRALFVKAEGYTPTKIKNPYLVHAMKREMNLEPIFDEPWRELRVYNARVARAHYRQDLIDAHRLLEDPTFDAAMSDAWGVDRLSKLPNLKRYMTDDVMPLALGERTWAERTADSNMALFKGMVHGPKWAWDRITRTGEYKDVDWQAWRAIWEQTYASRKAAGDIIGFQAAYRLAFSPSSAVANATQHWINTAPLLVGDGVSMTKALGMSMEAWGQAIDLWARQTWNQQRAFLHKPPSPLPKHLQALEELSDEAGILLMPGKHLAGAGGTSWSALVNEIPVGFGRGRLLRTKDIVKYSGMLMFNGAERVNRYGALIAGYNKAIKFLGMDHAAAVQYAKRLVRDTQFYYDDLSMPMLFHKMGPAGRMIFQFKGYIWNQVNLEARLAKKAAMGDPAAAKQLMAHLGMYFTLGGARGLASHPLITSAAVLTGGAAALAGLPSGFRDPAGALLNVWRNRRVDRLTPEQAIEGRLPGHYDDIVMHGLPGLINMSLGQRIGISGQEIGNLVDLTNWATLGPHLSVYGDFINLMQGYMQTVGSGPGTLGALGAGMASLIVPPAVTKGITTAAGLAAGGARVGSTGYAIAQALLDGGGVTEVQDVLKSSGYTSEKQDLARFLTWGSTKYPTLAAALLGGYLASQGSALDFGTYFDNFEEGRAFRSRALPTFIRAWSNAVETFANNATLDIDNKPSYLPPGRDVYGEALAAALNLPTKRREEERAMLDFLLHKHEKRSAERSAYVEAIGGAFASGDTEKAYELLAEALENGIDIEESAVQREIDSRTQEAIETVRQRVLQEVRYE